VTSTQKSVVPLQIPLSTPDQFASMRIPVSTAPGPGWTDVQLPTNWLGVSVTGVAVGPPWGPDGAEGTLDETVAVKAARSREVVVGVGAKTLARRPTARAMINPTVMMEPPMRRDLRVDIVSSFLN